MGDLRTREDSLHSVPWLASEQIRFRSSDLLCWEGVLLRWLPRLPYCNRFRRSLDRGVRCRSHCLLSLIVRARTVRNTCPLDLWGISFLSCVYFFSTVLWINKYSDFIILKISSLLVRESQHGLPNLLEFIYFTAFFKNTTKTKEIPQLT